jgi:hypothetical protein
MSELELVHANDYNIVLWIRMTGWDMLRSIESCPPIAVFSPDIGV